MNDNELMTLIREQGEKVPLTTTIDQVVRRGRHLQHRRRAVWAGGTLAVAATPAVVIGALPGATQPSTRSSVTHAPGTRLAAWTVTEEPSGDIDVTINQLKDPAGLQQTLRSDGVPASVSSSSLRRGGVCQPSDEDISTLRSVAQLEESDGTAHLVIHPSALPSGLGVAIFDDPGVGPSGPTTQASIQPPNAAALAVGGNPLVTPPSPPTAALTLVKALNGPLAIGLVEASPDCTG